MDDSNQTGVASAVESSRKAVTHPVSGGAAARHGAQASTTEGAAGSTPRTGPEVRKTVESVVPRPVASEAQDRTEEAPPPPPPPPPAQQDSSDKHAPAGPGTGSVPL